MTLVYMLHQGSGNLFSGEVGHMLSVVIQATIWRNAGVLALALVDAVNTFVKRTTLKRHANVLRGALQGLPVEGSALIVLEVALLAGTGWLLGETREQRKNKRDGRKRRNHVECPFW